MDDLFPHLQRFVDAYRAILRRQYHPAWMSDYSIAYLVGEYAASIQAQVVTPLHRHQLLPFGKPRDNVEWAVRFYLKHGYIPSIVYPESRYWLPLELNRLSKPDQRWLNGTPRKHPQAVGYQCIECGKWKPASDFAPDDRRKNKHSPYCRACEAKPVKDTKLCANCGKPFKASRDHFHADSRKPDGLMVYCIPCWREYDRRNKQRVRRAA